MEDTASGSRLHAREAVMVVIVSESRKTQPPARIWTRGGWWWWQVVEKDRKHRLRLAFGCEGGGDGGNRDGRLKNTTPGSHLDARGVVVVAGGRSLSLEVISGRYRKK